MAANWKKFNMAGKSVTPVRVPRLDRTFKSILRTFTWWMGAGLALAACTVKKAPLQPHVTTLASGEERAIYQALLTDSTVYGATLIVLVDSTESFDLSMHLVHLKSNMPSLLDETAQNFMAVNRESISLKGLSIDGLTCVLVRREESYAWERNWPEAGGAVSLSRVGFDRSGTQALVYYSVFWAPLAAVGSVALLEAKDGTWHIRSNVLVWIS
jgi:hypothetical protein